MFASSLLDELSLLEELSATDELTLLEELILLEELTLLEVELALLDVELCLLEAELALLEELLEELELELLEELEELILLELLEELELKELLELVESIELSELEELDTVELSTSELDCSCEELSLEDSTDELPLFSLLICGLLDAVEESPVSFLQDATTERAIKATRINDKILFINFIFSFSMTYVILCFPWFNIIY
jgi:hypothetical protein